MRLSKLNLALFALLLLVFAFALSSCGGGGGGDEGGNTEAPNEYASYTPGVLTISFGSGVQKLYIAEDNSTGVEDCDYSQEITRSEQPIGKLIFTEEDINITPKVLRMTVADAPFNLRIGIYNVDRIVSASLCVWSDTTPTLSVPDANASEYISFNASTGTITITKTNESFLLYVGVASTSNKKLAAFYLDYKAPVL